VSRDQIASPTIGFADPSEGWSAHTPTYFTKPSFTFLFAKDVATYVREKLARHQDGKERLGVLGVGPEIDD
jgi:hypothetical protein